MKRIFLCITLALFAGCATTKQDTFSKFMDCIDFDTVAKLYQEKDIERITVDRNWVTIILKDGRKETRSRVFDRKELERAADESAKKADRECSADQWGK